MSSLIWTKTAEKMFKQLPPDLRKDAECTAGLAAAYPEDAVYYNTNAHGFVYAYIGLRISICFSHRWGGGISVEYVFRTEDLIAPYE